ncbi:MAG: type II toxin-antitoxin system HicB family antitoxin [Chloroflexi bacterium]|nr:type II toxin-antitoxin system HicB family antitoxin [Chloroflexota bacterium]
MKTYVFRLVVEPDEDKWAAYCPSLVRQGASTWGDTPEEALRNIQEVLQMTLESLRQHGEAVPEDSPDIQVYSEPRVTVTL